MFTGEYSRGIDELISSRNKKVARRIHTSKCKRMKLNLENTTCTTCMYHIYSCFPVKDKAFILSHIIF